LYRGWSGHAWFGRLPEHGTGNATGNSKNRRRRKPM